jgi:large subunit ribosomal protein L1
MSTHGKKYLDAAKQIDREAYVSVPAAVSKVKELASAKFDETVDLAVNLGVDPRKADQILRGTLSLPAGTGRSVRVAVFAAGDQANEARDAGADIVGSDDLVARVNDGFTDFDVVIATPDLMAQVGTLGRVLGPRGLMPNPKTGTVTMEVGKAVSEFKAGRVEYRTDKVGNIHLPVGKVSFSAEDIVRNIHAVFDELFRVKPASAKGRYVLSAAISSTMGPSVKLDPALVREVAIEEPVGAAS